MKLKRIFTFFLALILLSVAVPVLSESGLNVNLLPNGNMETEEGIKLSDKATFCDTDKKSGEKSVKLETTNGGNPSFTIEAKNLTGGASYQLILWFKSKIQSENGGFSVTVDEYCNNRSSYDCHVIKHGPGEQRNVTTWTKMVYNFKIQVNTSLVAISPVLTAENGVVFVDDIDLRMTAEPEELIFKLSTDEIFYYTEFATGNGKATASLDNNFKTVGFTADFRFLDSNAVKHSAEKVAFDNNKATFTYPLELLNQRGREYIIEADVKGPDGKKITTLTQKIYKYDHPKGLSLDGRIYTDKNGKKVRPIVMYHIGEEDWESAASAGINVLQTSLPGNIADAKKMLDKMYDIGVYAAVVCYWGMQPAGHPNNIDRVRAFVEQIKDHPAVFCYMVMDEPFINNPNAYGNLEASYKMLREADDYHPIYICEGFAEYYDDVLRYSDIIAPDPYPGAWNHYGTFTADTLKKVVDKARGRGKMVLPIMQAFTYASNPVPESTPTVTQLHGFIYQAYLAGTDGLGWYTWTPDNYDYDKMIDEGKYWPTMLNYHNVEADILYPYFVEGKYPTLLKSREDSIWYNVWISENEIYMAVQNRLEFEKNITLPLVSANGKVTIDNFTAETVSSSEELTPKNENGQLKIKLLPYQAALIKIIPDKMPDTSLLFGAGDTVGFEWAEEAIDFMHEQNIAKTDEEGYAFRPGDKITRGEFAMYLIRTLGFDNLESNGNFSDINGNEIYATETAIGKNMGILTGVGNNIYLPDEGISRQDLMVICARAMRFIKALPGAEDKINTFPDKDLIAEYAKSAVASMVSTDIIKGNSDGSINPLGNTTRAEAAVIMQRIHSWKIN